MYKMYDKKKQLHAYIFNMHSKRKSKSMSEPKEHLSESNKYILERFQYKLNDAKGNINLVGTNDYSNALKY